MRADDLFSALLAKMIDMDLKQIDKHFKNFMNEIIAAKVFPQDSWKYVIAKSITDLENYGPDLPSLPNWLCDGLINPLLSKQTVQLSDIVWYKEEEKDELFDCTGQFKVAALILADMKSEGKDSAEQI